VTGGRNPDRDPDPDPDPGAALPPGPGMAHVPVRTCVGCREAAPQSELVRFATVDGRVVPDPAKHLPGRGAWLHPSPSCLERALARRAFNRAFRRPVQVDPDTVDLSHTWQRSASTS
jgi:predicted RNA-binding protein YlxR (DUF448 family)